MRVLLIWEEVPARTRMYLLDGETAEIAIAAHNTLVGFPEGGPADRLYFILRQQQWLDTSKPISLEGIDQLVLSGIIN